MSYEKFYPNGWQSGETGGTPITPEALNHIENGIKQTYSDFAPAGYGLGGTSVQNTITSKAALDTLKTNCWFLYANDNDPIIVSRNYIKYAYGSVSTYDNGRVKMTLVPVVPELKTTLVRYLTSNGWGEFMWENPPMIPGVEYLTTEMWNDKPVYTMLIAMGAAVNGGEADGTVVDITYPTCIRWAGRIAGHSLPYTPNNPSSASYADVDIRYTAADTITAHLYCGSSMVGQTAYVQVWYI